LVVAKGLPSLGTRNLTVQSPDRGTEGADLATAK